MTSAKNLVKILLYCIVLLVKKIFLFDHFLMEFSTRKIKLPLLKNSCVFSHQTKDYITHPVSLFSLAARKLRVKFMVK